MGIAPCVVGAVGGCASGALAAGGTGAESGAAAAAALDDEADIV
jgi:hypothetical protein